MDWHRQSGLCLLGLVAFRLIWGVIGSSTSRFGNFVRSPARVLAYVRAKPAEKVQPGHNPVGGYSVLVMLLVLALQITGGLFAVDVDGLESGYLSNFVTFEQGRQASELHEILFYRFVRKRNLITPMFTGSDAEIDSDAPSLISASRLSLIIAIVAAAALSWWVSTGLGL